MAQSAEGGTSAGVPEWTRDESVAAAMNNILITRRCRRGAADDGAEMIFVQFAINNLHSTINNTERAIKMGCCGSANRVQNHPRSASTKYLLPSHNRRTSGVRSTARLARRPLLCQTRYAHSLIRAPSPRVPPCCLDAAGGFFASRRSFFSQDPRLTVGHRRGRHGHVDGA